MKFFRELVDVESDSTTSLLIDINEFEHLLEKLLKSQHDTGEIAYNMKKRVKILNKWIKSLLNGYDNKGWCDNE